MRQSRSASIEIPGDDIKWRFLRSQLLLSYLDDSHTGEEELSDQTLFD
jgi:hypothetical protein